MLLMDSAMLLAVAVTNDASPSRRPEIDIGSRIRISGQAAKSVQNSEVLRLSE